MNTPETPLIVFFSILVGGGMTMVTMRVGVFYGGGGYLLFITPGENPSII